MSYQDKDTYGMYIGNNGDSQEPKLMGGNTLAGNHVYSEDNEDLGGLKK